LKKLIKTSVAMGRFFVCLLWGAVLFLFLSPWAGYAAGENFPSIFPGWSISGQNSMHLDYYNSHGPDGAYLQEGWRPYNDLNIQFQNRQNPYNVIKGYASGTVSGSPYRSRQYGVSLERFNINQENGEAALPYRLDLGDFHGFQTPRVLQKSMKGIQAELQPGVFLGAQNSLLLHGGGVSRDFFDRRLADNLFGGASWLMNWNKTKASLNFVYNDQAEQSGIPDLRQYVTGLAVNHHFNFLSQQLALDAELNYLRGDNALNGASFKDEGLGAFAQLQGRGKLPLNYSLRYEEYDKAYIPRGGVVSAGRRTIDARAGWQSPLGYSINGRGQYYRDGMGSAITTDTYVCGLGASGAIPNPWVKGINAGLDAYRQQAESDPSKTIIHAVNANLSNPLPWGWTSRLTASIQDTHVVYGIAADNRNQQYGFDLGHGLTLAGFSGRVNAGVVYSILRQTGQDSDDLGLNFASYLSRGPLSFNLSYRHLNQDRQTGLVDNLTHGLNAACEYTYKQHQLRLEADYGYRKPQSSDESADTRIALTWTFSFERPAKTAAAARVEAPPAEAVAATPTPAPAPEIKPEVQPPIQSLADLTPGMPVDRALAGLKKRNMQGGIQEGRNLVFETVWFDDVSQRQRLVLTQQMKYLERAAIIIDLNQVGELDNAYQLYERVRSKLNREFGAATTQEIGVFSPNLAGDLRNGKFIRISDWKTPTGILRLGIPRRLDGIVRIELQHAQSFPMSGYVSWSLEDVQ
jgi:hypothetical protein